MRLNFFILLGFILVTRIRSSKNQYEDNDFAEFEEFDEEALIKSKSPSVENLGKPDIINSEKAAQSEAAQDIKLSQTKQNDFPNDDEAIVEDEESDEFSHFSDEDEFIGYSTDKHHGKGFKSSEPKITIANVPLHLRSNWDSYYLEMIMLLGLGIYFLNFMYGKAKNQKISLSWFECHKELLESNFALVGDDGKSEVDSSGLHKESENVYILWCSGRTLIEGMLVELRLLKRQDLISIVSQIMKPSSDQLIVTINLDDMDAYVFAFATKKSDAKVLKEMTDINTYCVEKKSGEKYGLSNKYIVHCEIGEVATCILKDQKLLNVMNKHPGIIEYLHVSDQYSGPKQPEESQPTQLPEVKRTLIFGFNFDGKGNPPENLETMVPLMHLVLYMADKLCKMRLSKEMKTKAEKNRIKVEEAFMKATHAARAEMAQTMKEEKKRKERERIMNLDDPEIQRKWEEREQKKQLKKRAPKTRTLKMKPM